MVISTSLNMTIASTLHCSLRMLTRFIISKPAQTLRLLLALIKIRSWTRQATPVYDLLASMETPRYEKDTTTNGYKCVPSLIRITTSRKRVPVVLKFVSALQCCILILQLHFGFCCSTYQQHFLLSQCILIANESDKVLFIKVPVDIMITKNYQG